MKEDKLFAKNTTSGTLSFARGVKAVNRSPGNFCLPSVKCSLKQYPDQTATLTSEKKMSNPKEEFLKVRKLNVYFCYCVHTNKQKTITTDKVQVNILKN